MEIIKTFKEFNYNLPFSQLVRNLSRDAFLRFYAVKKNISNSTGWIRFPYYHHVFDDEKKGFERQLNYLKNYGDFISIDQACELISANEPLSGRYFCISFDDGYRCCYTNMMEITSRLDIPVIIYLPTDFISLNENEKEDIEILKANVPGNPKLITYLNWDQCREMLQFKISFGSHTKSHANLINLNADEIRAELSASKKTIEKELQTSCAHFACPWGRLHLDFDPSITKPIAIDLGYKSFATTNRGENFKGDDIFQIKRDHLLAGWGNYQLKYFFGK